MMPQAAWIASIHDGSAAVPVVGTVVMGRLLAASAMIPPASA